MADPPLALTYVAPALNLPPWLSYTSSPTATILAAYTVATLAADGVPTLITGAVEITRYETVLLQLAITVDSAADVRGQDLGDLYTTAGGTETETVVNEYGGTRRFTLGAGETSAAAAPTSPSATATPSRASATTSPAVALNRLKTDIFSTVSYDKLKGGAGRCPFIRQASSSVFIVGVGVCNEGVVAGPASRLEPVERFGLGLVCLSATSSAATPTTNLVSSSSPSSITPSSSSPVDSTNASSSSLPSSAADASAARSGSLTGSQLAAAIAAPICFFFLVIALLLLCCCCARRRRRRRADRGLAEEHGLLGGAGAGAGGGGRHGSPSGIMWEWVPHRRPSEPNGRTSRASIRSVLSRATGGLLGGAAGRSTRSGSTPGSSPRDARERGFLASSGGNATSEERAALGPGQYGPAGEADVAEGVGPSTPLLGVESPERSSPEEPSRSPRVHYLDFNARPTVAVPFEDVDLASPRPDAAGSFGSPPREMQQTRTRPVALPLLPPIPSTNGALRLSTLYDPPVITHLPPSPSSYEPPPLGAPRRLDVSSGDLDDVSSMSDGHKRDTRLGYLSWTQGGGGESDNERAVSGYGPELTPPQTPEDEEPGLRVGGDDDDDSLDGGPMLSTRPGALRRSFSSELSETGVPDSALFLNDPRWTGARQPSPPPFSSFEPTATSSISYDPPIFIHRQAPHDVEVGLRPQSHPRHSATSGTTDSLSRYDDGSSLAPSAFPLDSPLVYPSPRFGVPHLASASAVSASRNRTVGRERSVESGLSLERIAASFGSVKDGLGSGLGFDFGGEGGGSRRSVGRNREISTESMTDPFQHPYSSFQRRLPSLPSPANTPPRHPLHSRSSQSLRRPHSQPSLIFQSIPETSPEQGAATAAAVRRYVDPYADGEESLLDADEYGGGYGDAYVGGAKRWMGVSSRVSVEE
ncbi:uncharacterized protein RHOBADRAFT_42722 [Rhodotorula graminis WP1]|uniref:Dystroglycan-type cadherin-like domain-containing protein n=1 Tax=Rhodotorula graminis (strain WP1) TaxID=578459 RepID=A0A194SAG4_RHOGW|nr:uncharacterized protein RHOBADRAFT_42722 [Rhodotorula graminis WP1]KPV76391.1 hypothetical protein RHOBADRAFT_42722 [Rhodotorula graminis WP1]